MDERAQPGPRHLPGAYRILAAVNEAVLPLLALAIGVVGSGLGIVLIRSSGADTRVGRRLAGAPAASLRDLQQRAVGDQLPRGAVRIEGRVRCADPLITPDGDRLAALHRDVDVRLPDGRWRTIERLRESRPIDLWERTASVPLDLEGLAEPLITIPHYWEGAPDELGDTYLPAIQRLASEVGALTAARATTRQLTLVDQLIVLAVPQRDSGGGLRLAPPAGGLIIANVDLDTAMRLLAGPHRTRMLAGFALAAAGAVVGLVGMIGLLVLPLG